MRSIEFQPLRLVSATERVAATGSDRPAQTAKGDADVEVARTRLAGSDVPPIDHEKVVALRNAIVDGTYRIEPGRIADAMIDTIHGNSR